MTASAYIFDMIFQQTWFIAVCAFLYYLTDPDFGDERHLGKLQSVFSQINNTFESSAESLVKQVNDSNYHQSIENCIWIFFNEQDNKEHRFDSVDQLNLEFSFLAYKIHHKKQYKTIKTELGIVDLESRLLEVAESNGQTHLVKRKWSKQELWCKSMDHDIDFEWMSLNFRKYRADLLSKSIRRRILNMVRYNYQYLPSLMEILNGITKAEMQKLVYIASPKSE